jgi:hypothetical protein
MACCACNSVMVPIVGFNQVSCNMMMSACAVTYCEMSCWRAGRLRRPPTLWEMMRKGGGHGAPYGWCKKDL